MKNFDERLRRIEEQAARRRQRNDPRAAIRLQLQLAMMRASVPACDAAERQAELAHVEQLQRAYDTGNASMLDAETRAKIDSMGQFLGRR